MIKIIKGKLINNKIKTSKSLSWIKANIKMKEIIIIRGVFEKDKIISIRNKVFQFGKKFKEKNPKRNVNTNAKNSVDYKNSSNFNLLSTFIFETKYPLYKDTENYDNTFIPKLSFRFSPNETKSSTKKNARLSTNNIFDIDRSGQNDLVESDQSVTLGFDFEKIDKFNNNSI